MGLINAGKFKRNLAIRGGRGWVQDHIWPIWSKMTEQQFRGLVQRNESLVERTVAIIPPADLAAWREEANNYRAFINSLADTDFCEFLPEQYVKVAQAYGEQGRLWLLREGVNLRRLVCG